MGQSVVSWKQRGKERRHETKLPSVLLRLCRSWKDNQPTHRTAPLQCPGNKFLSSFIILQHNQTMADIKTAEITPRQCRHLLPFKEGKFGVVWALDGSNRNSQTRHVSQQTAGSEFPYFTNFGWFYSVALFMNQDKQGVHLYFGVSGRPYWH